MTAAIERVTFIHGDVWNVNPIALKRVERLFCKNERAVLRHAAFDRRSADAGAGRRHSGRQHPAAFPRCHAQRAEQGTGVSSPAMRAVRRATNSAGSSTVRPSSCWRRRFRVLRRCRGGRAHSRRRAVVAKTAEFQTRFCRACIPLYGRGRELNSLDRDNARNREMARTPVSGGGRHCAAAGARRRWSPSCACASAMNGCCPRASSMTARRRGPPPNAR